MLDRTKNSLKVIEEMGLTHELALETTKERIDFLESIYITGGENNNYSQTFQDAAYKERQELCDFTSELYRII